MAPRDFTKALVFRVLDELIDPATHDSLTSCLCNVCALVRRAVAIHLLAILHQAAHSVCELSRC